MTDSKKAEKQSASFAVETQQDRWLKYGANVILSVVVVIALVWAMVYLAQRPGWRTDTTTGGANSLKPQTVALIQNLPEEVRIVGLFTRTEENTERKVQDTSAEVQFQQVADLLQEYQKKSRGKIKVDLIDTVREPSKVDQLFNDVARKYGNDFQKYEEVMKSYGGTLDTITKLANEEVAAVLGVRSKINNEKLALMAQEIYVTLQFFPQIMDTTRRQVKEQLDLKVPDYKGAADHIRGNLEDLNVNLEEIQKRVKGASEDPATPKELKEYVVAAQPRLQKMKETSDELLKKIGGLGEIKHLDELRQYKQNRGSIAVLGPKDLKVIPRNAIFKTAPTGRGGTEETLKPRFAGEQQITTALVALTAKDKKRIAVVRSGGPPATTSIPMAGYDAPMADFGDRLRDYGIEIVEKDISGQWMMQAMQMQQQGMPLPPEPSDEELKGIPWVVLLTQMNPRMMMQNPQAGQLGAKVGEHLKNGGSAMILVDPQVQPLDFLKDWGIQIKPEYVVVHEKVADKGARSDDITNDWQRQQAVFVINEYGDHPLVKPLNSLDGLFVPVIPVDTVPAKGFKTAKILPMPTSLKSWGESDIQSLAQQKEVTFTAKKDDKDVDLPGPLWAGAVSEKEDGGGRLVVLGSRQFATDEFASVQDRAASAVQRSQVLRFPANAELLNNCVFWISHADNLISLSPSALEVPRVSQINDRFLTLLKGGVLIVLLPLGVVAAGTLVYLRRRD
ncbi:MAG: hypothetical protein JWN40_4089 [Phycisphaerales bacterium]|nr:hypothetical protein [Phycisphaerales bacterium]